jgi:hypothetical protein
MNWIRNPELKNAIALTTLGCLQKLATIQLLQGRLITLTLPVDRRSVIVGNVLVNRL